MKEHGLQKGQLKIGDKELKNIIEKYTREAGIRGLELSLIHI